jgi:hypothetical protein
MSAGVAAFALGCASAALIYAFEGVWCFIVPPLVGLYALWQRESAPIAQT